MFREFRSFRRAFPFTDYRYCPTITGSIYSYPFVCSLDILRQSHSARNVVFGNSRERERKEHVYSASTTSPEHSRVLLREASSIVSLSKGDSEERVLFKCKIARQVHFVLIDSDLITLKKLRRETSD